jgi:UDPglucose 6-dehydrogenase
MREAPSLVLIDSLLAEGCRIRAFDPVAINEARRRLGEETVMFCSDMYEACLDADALVIVTDWKQFRVPSWAVLRKTMRGRLIVDGRNLYEPAEAADEGFTYKRIG